MQQTVDIPVDKKLYLELPRDIPANCEQIQVELKLITKEVIPAMKEAEKIWFYNRTYPEELKAKLQKLRGCLPKTAFGGMGGVSYQNKIREEWDTN